MASDEEQVSVTMLWLLFLEIDSLTIYRIITLLTPLMRRMVTNERQRLYALESRKTLAAAKQAQSQRQTASAASITGASPQPGSQQRVSSTPSATALDIDPKLNQYHYSIEPQSQSPAPPGQRADGTAAPRMDIMSLCARKAAELAGPKYLVSVMRDGRRIMPRFTLDPHTCPTFSSVSLHIKSFLDDDGLTVVATKVMSPGGLVAVNDESSWAVTVELIKQSEWMDEEVRCVVEVE